MIFPGMDPWLEDPPLWPDLHESLIVYLRAQLQPLSRSRYVAAIEQRLYVEGPDRNIAPAMWIRERASANAASRAVTVAEVDEPLVADIEALEVHESYIEIRDLHGGQNVVTVIEVVSPANKCPGPGRRLYKKNSARSAAAAHLVEIDLLRSGRHVLALPEMVARRRATYDYLVSVNRAVGNRGRFQFYPRRLRDRLPRIAVPLTGDDLDVPLDLQAGLARVYRGRRLPRPRRLRETVPSAAFGRGSGVGRRFASAREANLVMIMGHSPRLNCDRKRGLTPTHISHRRNMTQGFTPAFC